jgi:hypothetical protein
VFLLLLLCECRQYKDRATLVIMKQVMLDCFMVHWDVQGSWAADMCQLHAAASHAPHQSLFPSIDTPAGFKTCNNFLTLIEAVNLVMQFMG